MVVSHGPSQPAALRFKREFAQWFDWASISVAAVANHHEICRRLEVLSRLAVWFVFDWMLHEGNGSLKSNRAADSMQRVLALTPLTESELGVIPLRLVWPLKGQAQPRRCLWDVVSGYVTLRGEYTENAACISPAIFGAIFNTLLSARAGSGLLSLQKQHGSFDTPGSVATDMVCSALETVLAARVPAIKNLRMVLRGKVPIALLPSDSQTALADAIARLTIIDPACGAGIFPLRMTHELDRLLAQFDPSNYRVHGSPLCSSSGRDAPPALQRRWFVLTRCMYGIDIQPLAVDITRMRYFFWLLETVEHPQDWVRPLLSAVFSDRVPIITTDALATDAVTQFGVAGFDIAIANPPYVDSETMVKHQPALRKQYAAAFQSARGNWDLFVVFIEWGLRSLTSTGVLTYIVPNKLISAPYAIAVRQLLQHYGVTQIQDFSDVAVFREARVYPVVITAQQHSAKRPVTLTVMQSLTHTATTQVVEAEQFYQDTEWSRHFAPAALQPLLDHCNAFPPMGRWFPAIAPAMTVREAYALQPMLREAPCHSPHKKLVNTGTIDRYHLLWGDRPTRYLKQRYHAPVVHDDDLHRLNPIRLRQAATPKLIVGGMTRQLECCYDAGQCLAGKSTTIILPGQFDLRYALALLNSPLISLWYCNTYGALSLAGGYLRISHRELKTIPMPAPTLQQQQQIIASAEQLMAAAPHHQLGLEHELNTLIYQLYGLTHHDIQLIESMRTLREPNS